MKISEILCSIGTFYCNFIKILAYVIKKRTPTSVPYFHCDHQKLFKPYWPWLLHL